MRKQLFIIILPIFLLGLVDVSGADYSSLTIPRILYKGGNDGPRPEALRSLLAQIARRTSVDVNREPISLKLSDQNLFKYPFIYLGGDKAFEPVSYTHLTLPTILLV